MNLYCFGTSTASLALGINIALGSFLACGQDGIVVTDKPSPLDHGPIEVGGESVELHIAVNDAAGKPLPCRIHLFDANEKPVLPTGYPAWWDHFVCDGQATLRIPTGKYRYEIERGHEHERLRGDIDLKVARKLSLQLERFTELAKLGWYSGDLHIHRSIADIELLMMAEDLHVGPLITWWNQHNQWTDRELPRTAVKSFDGNRLVDVMAGEDERGGGALLYFHLAEPLAIAKAEQEFPRCYASLTKRGGWMKKSGSM
ncbi:MAG: hypothetical protein R3C56_34935 [Pirellulaceae bacterium]